MVIITIRICLGPIPNKDKTKNSNVYIVPTYGLEQKMCHEIYMNTHKKKKKKIQC